MPELLRKQTISRQSVPTNTEWYQTLTDINKTKGGLLCRYLLIKLKWNLTAAVHFPVYCRPQQSKGCKKTQPVAVGSVQRRFAHPLSVHVTWESNYSLMTVAGIAVQYSDLCSKYTKCKSSCARKAVRAAEVMGGKHLVNKGFFFHWELCYKLYM